MSDLISRQAAIDAINHICPVDTEYDCTLLDRVDVRCVLSDLPSAQFEKRTDKSTETHACVCIIDKLKAKSYSESEYGVPEFDANKVIQLSDAIEIAKSFIEDVEAVKDLLPQPKIGHWRHYEGMLICSECGAEFYDDIMEYCGDDVPKRCPDCGVKIESEET